MRFRSFVGAAIVAAGIASAQAQGTAPSATTDWATLGRFLSLVQVFMQAAAAGCPPGGPTQGCDPNAAQKAFDDVVNGRNPEANALLLDIFAGVPQPEREKLLSIGRSMAALSRKDIAAQAQSTSDARAIQARKDLAGMGLVYHDRNEFLDAVRRNDVLAVKLFLAGRGVDATAADPWGNSALELARRSGNAEMIALLSAATAK
jgi:hypothetical protein